MSSNEGDERMEHHQELWLALDLTAYALALFIIEAHENGHRVPASVALYLEKARIVALEGVGLDEASSLAMERVGMDEEEAVRWAKGFAEARENSSSRDHFEGSDAETLAELWGNYKRRFPNTLVELEQLVQELREIIDRSPGDPERQELVRFVPGRSAKEVRETLYRRRSR